MMRINNTAAVVLLQWTDPDGDCSMGVGPGASIWVDDSAPFKTQADTELDVA